MLTHIRGPECRRNCLHNPYRQPHGIRRGNNHLGRLDQLFRSLRRGIKHLGRLD
jgi:hypothetical protein